CYDINSKTKIIKNNQLWKYNFNTSYCVHETNNDCSIFRVGGEDNNKIPNVEYSMKNDEYHELPLTQTKTRCNSIVLNVNHGLITIGGFNDEDKFFFFGGYNNDNKVLNSSEMCDLNDDKNKNQNDVNQFISSKKWINLTNM